MVIKSISLFNCKGKVILLNFLKSDLLITRTVNVKMASEWKQEKTKFLEMPIETKRQLYACKNNYVMLKDIQHWADYFKTNNIEKIAEQTANVDKSLNKLLAEKVSVWSGDITQLEIDAIANAANKTLLGGGGVDGAIHRAASRLLTDECAALLGCETGYAKITGGYRLPARHVIHTVGPVGENPEDLKNCYNNCLDLALQHKLKTVAFPCISTGVYGYPIENATRVALSTVRLKLEKHSDSFDRIIFVVFLAKDKTVYERLLQTYFPVD